MNTIKSQIMNPATHYKVFFHLVKFSALLHALLAIFGAIKTPEALSVMGFQNSMMILSGFVVLAIQFVLVKRAETLISNDDIKGFWVVVIISILEIYTMDVFFGLFGFWSILNIPFSKTNFLVNRPLWMCEIYDQIEKLTSPKQA